MSQSTREGSVMTQLEKPVSGVVVLPFGAEGA